MDDLSHLLCGVVHRADAATFGWLLSAQGIGGLVGAFLMARLSSTIVMKVTRGTLRDLTPGMFARVSFASGTKTVTAISLSSRFGFRPGGNRRPAGRSGTPRAGRFGGGLFAGGQVVKVASGKLTVRTFSGSTATYTLAKNVTVTRSVTGKLSDLKVGETVRIGAPPGSKTAFSITIQSA